MNPKINAYFIIFLLLFSMYPVPITSAEFTDETNTVYEGKNFIGTIPSVANADQGYKFQIEDDLISWSIDSITTRTNVFEKVVKEDKVGASSLNSSTSTYINATPLFKSDINFKFTDNSMKQTIIIEKSDIDAQANYTYFTIDETILTTKDAENYYIDINTSEKISWTAVNKNTKNNIQAKELFFGNKRLRLIEPIAHDENGKSINGYYDVIASNNHTFDVKTVFLKSDIDTLSGTIYFDPTIENGYTGYTTQTYSSLSENQSITVPNGTSYDLNITNQVDGDLFGSEYAYNSATTEYVSVSVLDSTHFVVTYRDVGNSGHGTAVIGEVSGSTISYGSEYVFNSASTNYIEVAALDSTHFVVVYQNDSGYGTAIVGTVSGNTITSYGTPNIFNAAYTSYNYVTALDSGKFVVTYTDGGNSDYGTAIVGTVSGNTITSYGSEYPFTSQGTYYKSVATLNQPSLFVVVYCDFSGDGFAAARIGEVSGTTITYGAANTFNAECTMHPSVAVFDSTKFVVVYDDAAKIGTASGTTIISYGAENIYYNGASEVSVTVLDSNHFVVAYQGGSSYGTTRCGDVSGTTITYGAANTFNAAYTLWNSITTFDSTHFVVTYIDSGNSDYGAATIGSTTPSLINIKATVTGDSNEQSYSASQSREFILTPTGYVENLIINTTSTDYDGTVTTYWTEDTLFIEETVANGYVKQYINYTPSFNITSADLNTTIINDLTTHDYTGTNTSTLNGESKPTTRVLQEVNASVGSLTKDVEYLWNVTIPYNNIFTLSEQANKDVDLGESELFTDSTYNDPDNNSIASRLWNFGDGDNSSSSNPSHIYTTIGIFNANYTVTEDATTDSQTITKEFTVNVTVQPPQNLTNITDLDQIHFDWDDYSSADYWNISRLDVTIPFTSTHVVLDGIKDACYSCCCAYGFVFDEPNPYTTYGRGLSYILRNDTYLIMYNTGEDNDGFSQDDKFIVGIDASNNNLTTDDRKFILGEGGTVTAKEWTGSAWNPVATNAQGVVVGGGTPGAIQYEMFIPVSELDTNFTNGSTVKFFMSRTHTASNPDIESYYPQTLINTTDATLWQSVLLSSEAQYTYINNTTASDYTVTGLDPFTWYQHKFVTINGSQESSGVNSVDITLDTPSYSIEGYIKDSSGNPIANADVWGENGYPLEHNVSNASGYYIGTHFHNGTYTIYASATNTVQNSISITVLGANLTNQNITLNYDNFTFTNAQVFPNAILEGDPFTVSVDINDTDGTIATAIVKIDGTNYTMTNSTGDTWIYTFTNTAIPTRYFVQNFYAQDNSSAWNSTTSTLSVIVSPTTGTGGFGGVPTDAPEPITEEEEPVPEEPTDIGSIFDVLGEKLSEATNITTIKNIFKSKAVAFIGVKYTVGNYSTTREIVKPEAFTCEPTDPRVSCYAMNGAMTITITPTTNDSRLFQLTDTHVKITNNNGDVYNLPVSLSLINLMWYFDLSMDTGIENPYIVARDAKTDTTVGVRGWWVTVIAGLAILGFIRKYN